MIRVRVDFTRRPWKRWKDPGVRRRIRENVRYLEGIGFSRTEIKAMAHLKLRGPDANPKCAKLIRDRLQQIMDYVVLYDISWEEAVRKITEEVEGRVKRGQLAWEDDPLVKMGYVEM